MNPLILLRQVKDNHQDPLSMGFYKQEFWTGLPFPSPKEMSQPRDQTWFSCMAGRFFPDRANRQAQLLKEARGNQCEGKRNLQ